MIKTAKNKKEKVTTDSLKSSEQKQSLFLKRLTIIILIICALMFVGAIVIFSKNLLGSIILIALFVLCGLIWIWIKKLWKKSEESVSDKRIQADEFVEQFSQVQHPSNDENQDTTETKSEQLQKKTSLTHTNYFNS